jgi:hypothetical protein
MTNNPTTPIDGQAINLLQAEVHDLKIRPNGAMICFSSYHNKRPTYVTYSLKNGLWSEVVEGLFTIKEEILNELLSAAREKGVARIIDEANIFAFRRTPT